MTMVAEQVGTLSVTKLHPHHRGGNPRRRPQPPARRRDDAPDQGCLAQARRPGVPRPEALRRRPAPLRRELRSRRQARAAAEGLDQADDGRVGRHDDDHRPCRQGRQAGRLARPRRDVVPHRQVLPPQPHRATFLYGIEIPSEGGDTRFSSMYAAYDKMPADLKRKLDGKMVMQGYQYGHGHRIDLSLDISTLHHCVQPLILTNPGSGPEGTLCRQREHDVDRRHGPRRERDAPAAVLRHRGRPRDHLRAQVARRRPPDVGQSRLPARAHRLADRADAGRCAAARSRASRSTERRSGPAKSFRQKGAHAPFWFFGIESDSGHPRPRRAEPALPLRRKLVALARIPTRTI